MPEDADTLAALRRLLAGRFPPPARKSAGIVRTGAAAVDDALGGGLPAGLLTELVSAGPSTGGQLVLARLLETTRAARQRVALIDGADGFAPDSVSPDALRHLVWVRCRDLERAFAAADLLVRDGNYAALVLDLRGLGERALRRHPASAWFRLHRAAEGGSAAMLVQTAFPLIPSVRWRLVLRAPQPLEALRLPREEIAERISVEVDRGRAAEAEERSA
jgi:hypothetical protein